MWASQSPGSHLIAEVVQRFPRHVHRSAGSEKGEKEVKKKQPAKIQKRIQAGCKDWCRHLPIFPGRFQPSILGASGLNCRVRDGNGCTPTAIGTDSMKTPSGDSILKALYTLRTEQRVVKKCLVSHPKRSSSRFHAVGQALGLLVLPS